MALMYFFHWRKYAYFRLRKWQNHSLAYKLIFLSALQKKKHSLKIQPFVSVSSLYFFFFWNALPLFFILKHSSYNATPDSNICLLQINFKALLLFHNMRNSFYKVYFFFNLLCSNFSFFFVSITFSFEYEYMSDCLSNWYLSVKEAVLVFCPFPTVVVLKSFNYLYLSDFYFSFAWYSKNAEKY